MGDTPKWIPNGHLKYLNLHNLHWEAGSMIIIFVDSQRNSDVKRYLKGP